jgi:glucosamine-phosphate N-acetyltransferase
MTFDLSNNMIVRKIEKHDYYKQYCELLQQLTTSNSAAISKTTYDHFIDNLNDNHIIYVIEDIPANIIIGTITLLIEHKIIHNMGKVAHIEDVVVHSQYRGQQLGKLLIDTAITIANDLNCYKIILDCSDNNIGFYKKCGFNYKCNQMSFYF